MKTKTILFLTALFFGAFVNVTKADEANNEKVYTLEECIDLAVENLPELAAAKSRVKQQEENLRAANTLKLPRLDAEIKYNRLPESIPQKKRYLGESLNDFQADVILRQPLYAGGKTEAEVRAARHALDAVNEEYRIALNNSVFNIKTAYVKLLHALYMLESKEALLKSTQWFYGTALDLNRKTKIPREETLLRIEVQLNQVRQDVISARQDYLTAQKTLLGAMGLDTSGDINIAKLPETAPDKDASLKKTFAQKNPEVLAINNRIKESQAQIQAAKSGYYPEVSALLSYGYEWPGIDAGGVRWTAGVNMGFSLWNWGQIKAVVKKSMEREHELEANRESLINNLELSLENALLKFKAASAKFEIASGNLELARRSLKLFEKRYHNTTATSIELLDSQKAFSETQAAYATALLEMRIASAEIGKITGGYFENK
ncbi:MAG: TolC family protein [Candidatus Aureabacteria bacterium]|nr:TolC family protein [Candidatus Auribacterota bacterium]